MGCIRRTSGLTSKTQPTGCTRFTENGGKTVGSPDEETHSASSPLLLLTRRSARLKGKPRASVRQVFRPPREGHRARSAALSSLPPGWPGRHLCPGQPCPAPLGSGGTSSSTFKANVPSSVGPEALRRLGARAWGDGVDCLLRASFTAQPVRAHLSHVTIFQGRFSATCLLLLQRTRARRG